MVWRLGSLVDSTCVRGKKTNHGSILGTRPVPRGTKFKSKGSKLLLLASIQYRTGGGSTGSHRERRDR